MNHPAKSRIASGEPISSLENSDDGDDDDDDDDKDNDNDDDYVLVQDVWWFHSVSLSRLILQFWTIFRSERAVSSFFPPYIMPKGSNERIIFLRYPPFKDTFLHCQRSRPCRRRTLEQVIVVIILIFDCDTIIISSLHRCHDHDHEGELQGLFGIMIIIITIPSPWSI